jgi:hypothetical protein
MLWLAQDPPEKPQSHRHVPGAVGVAPGRHRPFKEQEDGQPRVEVARRRPVKVMVAAVLPEMLKETAMLGKSRVAVWNRNGILDVRIGALKRESLQ